VFILSPFQEHQAMVRRKELDKMLSGELYSALDPELVAKRRRARRLTQVLNGADPDRPEDHTAVLRDLLGGLDEGCWIEPPFHCDYGSHIFLGKHVYMNFGCIILDCARVEVGENTMFGPAVQLYTATHPINAAERITGQELARPITVGANVWIGGGAIIGPGLTIGDGTTIGAGSVVTRDIPANVFAAGNPCRVIKDL
jgi:maltose O-acetyltransferase